tara:strand:- start:242 stop:454 length:213 start_codon:yes stop_codon:yes gene_type:complete
MNNDKTLVVDTPEGISNFRNKVLLSGLELELMGMKMSRGQSCATIIKKEFGLKGNKQSIRDQFAKMLGKE